MGNLNSFREYLKEFPNSSESKTLEKCHYSFKELEALIASIGRFAELFYYNYNQEMTHALIQGNQQNNSKEKP